MSWCTAIKYEEKITYENIWRWAIEWNSFFLLSETSAHSVWLIILKLYPYIFSYTFSISHFPSTYYYIIPLHNSYPIIKSSIQLWVCERGFIYYKLDTTQTFISMKFITYNGEWIARKKCIPYSLEQEFIYKYKVCGLVL